MIALGIEKLIEHPPSWLKGQRLGLLCNQASVDRNFVHSRDLIGATFPGQLTCLFSPQHGFYSEKQDNMIESDHISDASGLAIYSLYGDTRKPDSSMFANLDVLLVDLPDVGTRVYTFMSTLAYCLEVAAAEGKKVVVLDRPNPIGGLHVEGNVLQDDCRSFVGLYSLPMRHGLTFGELALYFNSRLPQPAELSIVAMEGWQRKMLFPETGHPWVFPSPNLPTFHSALVYPGQVIWEGTNISEGRGTTLPFELFGAPYVRHDAFVARVRESLPGGCLLRPVCFEPTSNKWAGQPCVGFHLHVTDPETYKPYLTSLLFLQAFLELYPDHFQLKKPPYEYEYEKVPMDLILGDAKLLEKIRSGVNIVTLESEWQQGLDQYKQERQSSFLYN